MKQFPGRFIINILEKAEQALMASAWMYEMGFSPIEANYFMPIVYSGLWETQYFVSIAASKLLNSAEPQSPSTTS